MHPASPSASASEPDAATRAALGVVVVLVIASGIVLPGPFRSADQALDAGRIALRINPNTAPAEELMLIPGIGPALAGYIIDYRLEAASGPPFSSAEDLDYVYRIGPVTVERMRPYLTFESAPPSAAPDPGPEQHP